MQIIINTVEELKDELILRFFGQKMSMGFAQICVSLQHNC